MAKRSKREKSDEEDGDERYAIKRARAGCTAAELIEALQALPPETPIWLEKDGEHYPLSAESVSAHEGQTMYDAEEGGELEDIEIPVCIIGTD